MRNRHGLASLRRLDRRAVGIGPAIGVVGLVIGLRVSGGAPP